MSTKTVVTIAAVLITVAAQVPPNASATELWANSLPGLTEGIPSGALPPKGLYFSENTYWASFSGYDNGGNPTGMKVDSLILIPVALWVPGKKILGAEYGALLAQAFDYNNLRISGLQSNGGWGRFNTYIEPILLSWGVGDGVFIKGGLAFSLNDASSYPGKPPSGGGAPAGNGYWSTQPEVGLSWFRGGWNFNIDAQYSFNQENKTTSYKSGQQLGINFSLLRKTGLWTYGIGGYSINQITADSGLGASAAGCSEQGGCKTETYGVGPLLGYQLGAINFMLEYNRSLYTRNYTGGNIVNARVTVPF